MIKYLWEENENSNLKLTGENFFPRLNTRLMKFLRVILREKLKNSFSLRFSTYCIITIYDAEQMTFTQHNISTAFIFSIFQYTHDIPMTSLRLNNFKKFCRFCTCVAGN